MPDTWNYHWQGVEEYHLLMNDPREFISSLFYSGYESGYGEFFSARNSWWNDVKSNIFRKFLATLNIFSFGNYYLNLLLYSFITLFGNFALFRVMKEYFRDQTLPVFIGCFLLPSFIFFTSGIHKDGIIFLCIAMLTYIIYFAIKERKSTSAKIIVFAISLLILLLMRNFLVLTLLPAVGAWLIARRLKRKHTLVFGVVYILFIIFFFTAKYIHPSLDLPAAASERQASFIRLNGTSSINVEQLDPTFEGFVKLLPQAIYLSMLRPVPGDIRHLQLLASSIEVFTFLLLFLTFLLFRKKIAINDPTFLLFCIFFSISVLIMIGYSVNSLGAIVRYRSLILPFLMTPVIALTDWRKLASKLHII